MKFKKKVLLHFPEAQAQSNVNNAILILEQGMQQMLKQAFNSNYESDVILLSKSSGKISSVFMAFISMVQFQMAASKSQSQQT